MNVDRPPIFASRLQQALAGLDQPAWSCRVVIETGSTNADLGSAARAGAAEGQVLLAESQTAGRGRLGREWRTPTGAGLMLSVLLRPSVDQAAWGWLPLLAGIALADTVRELGQLDASLKWPNDLLVNGRKCAGILAEVPAPSTIVIGIGLNVSQRADELPAGPTGLPATSLALDQAAVLDRTDLAVELLVQLHQRYRQWLDHAGDAVASGLREAYLERCATLGRTVKVMLAGSEELVGVASTVDDGGQLVIDTAGTLQTVAAGDVLHLR